MVSSRSAGGVVIGPQGKIAIVNQRGNSWSLPKGHIEAGETSLQAALREIWEETGLEQLTLICELGTYERFKLAAKGDDDRGETKIITLFLFSTKSEKLAPIDRKNPEARWVDVDEVCSLLTHTKDREFFEAIRAEIGPHLAASADPSREIHPESLPDPSRGAAT